MKKTALVVWLFCCMQCLRAQQNPQPGESFYALDENFKGTTIEKAKYLVHVTRVKDSCWQFDTYQILGPMVSSEQYNDEKGSEANGHFCYFNKNGEIDSSGTYRNGLRDGDWNFLNSKRKVYLQQTYRDGELIATKDAHKLDSLEQLRKAEIEKNSRKINETESDFPGGVNGWISYLTKNLKYPDRAQNYGKQGAVVIQFIVDKEGHILSPEIVKSVEFSLDQEALRLIKESPVWKPAMQDGKLVKSYKKQPITFRLE